MPAVKFGLDPSQLAHAAGKTVIVTGAANGIGAATATLYNKHGANVVIADLAMCRTTAETQLIPSLAHPERAAFVSVDILDWAQMKALFRETIERFGGVDVVVANAGIMESSPVLDLEDVDEAGELKESREAFKVIDVNVKGTLNTLRLAMHHMKSSGQGGSVILVASTSGYFGGTGVVGYITSKHGVVGLLRSSQAAAKKYGVRVNGIAPFFTPTHITSSYSAKWKEAGLEANTAEHVASVIAQTSLEESRCGSCILVSGSYLRELEGPRVGLIPEWMGEDVADLIGKAGRFFGDLGGYPLPKKQ